MISGGGSPGAGGCAGGSVRGGSPGSGSRRGGVGTSGSRTGGTSAGGGGTSWGNVAGSSTGTGGGCSVGPGDFAFTAWIVGVDTRPALARGVPAGLLDPSAL